MIRSTGLGAGSNPVLSRRKSRFKMTKAILLAVIALPLGCLSAEPFRVVVTDRENGWPVPLVELRTTHNVRFYTDNAGTVALDLPELFGRETWLFLESDGYEVPKDRFGYRGFRVTPEPGGTFEVKVDRTIIAKRFGRLTGAGLFGESKKLGEFQDWRESGIFGCDSVQNAEHRGKLFWAWGDTNLAKYPLGIFDMTGATTTTSPLTTFEPPLQLGFDYFRNEENKQLRGIAPIEGAGPTWLSGFVSLPDTSGESRLVAHYVKVKPPLTVYRTGLCVWNDETGEFENLKTLWEKSDAAPKAPAAPDGHPVFYTDSDGTEWVLFGDPFPHLKIPVSLEAWSDPEQWDSIDQPEKLVSADGGQIEPHRGSIAWNEFRNRWITIFCQTGGSPSFLGEIWYAEADSPFGPWGKAVKVLSHQNYSFYNPKMHPGLVPEDSSFLLFEGTYTKTFSKAATATPRYNYNQILYRVDLDEPRLAPAQ